MFKEILRVFTKENEESKRQKLAKNYHLRFSNKWNEDIITVLNKVENNEIFWWNLIKQECEMYCFMAKQIELDDFNAIINRRGFNQKQIDYLKEMLIYIGIGNNLK